jgi:GNAT superfamily N-acetyltransferase
MSIRKEPDLVYTIRSAMPSDYAICQALDHTVSTDFVWQMILDTSLDGGQNVTFRQARLPRSMKVMYPRSQDALRQSWDQHGAFLVAEWDHQVVGYVNIRHEPSQETAWVADLVVDRSSRLQKIGTKLLDASRTWAQSQDLRRLIVETQTKSFPAIQFLKRNGLVFCGYNDLFYPNQDIALFFGQMLR